MKKLLLGLGIVLLTSAPALAKISKQCQGMMDHLASSYRGFEARVPSKVSMGELTNGEVEVFRKNQKLVVEIAAITCMKKAQLQKSGRLEFTSQESAKKEGKRVYDEAILYYKKNIDKNTAPLHKFSEKIVQGQHALSIGGQCPTIGGAYSCKNKDGVIIVTVEQKNNMFNIKSESHYAKVSLSFEGNAGWTFQEISKGEEEELWVKGSCEKGTTLSVAVKNSPITFNYIVDANGNLSTHAKIGERVMNSAVCEKL